MAKKFGKGQHFEGVALKLKVLGVAIFGFISILILAASRGKRSVTFVTEFNIDLSSLLIQQQGTPTDDINDDAVTTDMESDKSPPYDVASSPLILSKKDSTKRCQITIGTYCEEYYSQVPVIWNPPPQGNKPCLWGCTGVGVCNAIDGWCSCPAGWQGDACDVRMRRPCSHTQRKGGFVPTQTAKNFTDAGLMGGCAFECDEDIGMCFCPSNTKYGRTPAPIDAAPGTPPTQFGRPLDYKCQPGRPEFSKERMNDWCNNENPKYRYSECTHDNFGGNACTTPKEAFCVNQCNGHGECTMGFCKCDEGWFGQDCAYRVANIPWKRGKEQEREWIRQVAYAPASWDPSPEPARRRPLIYVYEMPPRFTSNLLQYRLERLKCIHRTYTVNETANNTSYERFTYNLETGLHEYLLQSEHRTLDPEEADFFYVPVYSSCFMSAVFGNADFPHFHGGYSGNRAHSATNFHLEAWSYIQSHHPYWDRKGGKDHLLLATHDEGSCYIPAVWRNATLLAHWGYTGFNNVSFTNYGQDRFDFEHTHQQYQPEGHLWKLGLYRCYDRTKDLVVPSMWPPQKYPDAPLFGAPSRERTILAFHKGRVMEEHPRFSRGSRQRLTNHTAENGWWEKYKIYIGPGNPPNITGGYSELLASTVFCPVLMGDGWTARFEDAVVHGCIPVIIMDDVHVSFESIIDVSKFSLRYSFNEMAELPEKLLAIKRERIEEMQQNIAKVWRRFFYSGIRVYQPFIKTWLKERKKRWEAESLPLLSQPAPEFEYDPAEDDAFATIIQWLYSKMSAVNNQS